jgi:hypothetical protein
MSLLREIDTNARLSILEHYLRGLEELDVDPNDEIVFPNIYKMVEDACGGVIEEGNPRSEYAAAREIMKGRGINPDRMKRKEDITRQRLENPRLGLQAHDPAQGDRVKLAGKGGIGVVTGVKGNAVRIKNQAGYELDTPRHLLQAKAIHNPKTGQNEVVWIEEM